MSEHPEYNRDTNPYPSFGKKYNGERAIISLTSWTARINTVSKTLFSLIKQCPGFHIVLVLSEEEFPKMMDELPDNLKLFVDNELIELLWVYKNYRSFKKIFFTQDKYRELPIISADDGCIYIRNFAQELYDNWFKEKNKIISQKQFQDAKYKIGGGGYGTLYPPYCFKNKALIILTSFYNTLIKNPNDDRFISILAAKLGIKYKFLNNKTFVNITKNDGLSELGKYKGGRNTEFEKMVKLV